MRCTTKLLATVLLLVGTLAVVPPTPAFANVDCQPAAAIRASSTYGSIHSFGAQCAANLNVRVEARVVRNGLVVGDGSVRCTRTTSGQRCESYIRAGNPAGSQTFRLRVNVYVDLAGVNDTPWMNYAEAVATF
jgi:hypothetical protein